MWSGRNRGKRMANEQSSKDAPEIPEAEVAGEPRRARFEDLASGEGPGASATRPEQDESDELRLDVIQGIQVTLSVEVGRTEMSIRELLQLGPGSVVELDRLAGEALDVLVNGTLVAQGEVVVIDDRFGLRLTDIVSPGERVRRLR